MSEETDKRLAKREARARTNELRTRQAMIRVARRAAETLERLFLPDGDPNQHPDAKETWADCSMQTRAALILAKTANENPEADLPKVFGIIIMQGRSKSATEWEAQARQVERDTKMLEAERRAAAIDAHAEPKAATG